jgi:AraC-like DNA-binding protein
VFGVSLKPEGLVALFNFAIAEATGTFAEARAFFGDWLGDLPRQIQEMRDPEAGARAAGVFFRERMKSAAPQIEQPYLTHAVQHIRRSTGTDSLDELSNKVYVGKRQLQRVFTDKIGFGPKVYGRIVRFRHTIEYVRRHPRATWTEISYEFGYADQSHFIRDFREFTGENPTVFLSNYAPQMNMPVAVAC